MSNTARSWVLSLVLLSQFGCTVGPDYVRPEVDSPEQWRVDHAAAADAANMRWWEQFNDPVLNSLIDTALRENKDVRIAAARVEEFAARVDIARSGFYPQIGYNAQASRNRGSREAFMGIPAGSDRDYNDYSATLSAGWEVDLWGRIRRSTEAARANLLAQEENRRAVILSLVSTVASTYVQLRQLDQQLVISRETLETRAQNLDLFTLKFEGGVISDLELAQVKVEYEQAAASIPPLERQIAFTENALSVLLGHNPGSIPRGKTINALVAPPVPAGTPSSLLARRPDVRAAEQSLVAANARIGVVRAQYFPTISLTGLFGYVSEELDNLLKNAANVWSFGGNALGPIFTGGAVTAQVRASEAVQRQALVGYLQTVQGAFQDVDNALVSVQKTREQLAAEGRRVKALNDYARLALVRYNEGYSSYIDVLDAQRSLFDAQLQYAAVQGDVYASLVGTYKAMGGGWVVEAQRTADETDFPGEQNDNKDAGFAFPRATRPSDEAPTPAYQ
ncbi:MAG: efflux transporter outer membrane subunit [Thiogranum sp.]